MTIDADGVEPLMAAWSRIELWLQAHAPASADLLRPPASEADIVEAEEAMNVEIPPMPAAWYRIHDGVDEDRAPEAAHVAGILPSNRTMLPLERLVAEYVTHQEWDGREAGILPFARTPGDTWYGWYVDARKGKPSYGNLGSWAVDDADEPYPQHSGGWPLPDWLMEIAAALEQGRPMIRPDGSVIVWDRPALYRDGLTWVDPRHLRIDAIVLDGAPGRSRRPPAGAGDCGFST